MSSPAPTVGFLELDYPIEDFVLHTAAIFAIRPLVYDSTTTHRTITRKRSKSASAKPIVTAQLKRWDIGALDSIRIGSSGLSSASVPLWSIAESVLNHRALGSVKSTYKSYEASGTLNESIPGDPDDGCETTLVEWCDARLKTVISYGACLASQEVMKKYKDKERLTTEVWKSLFMRVARLGPRKPPGSSAGTAPDLLVEETCCIELKAFRTFGEELAKMVDEGSERSLTLEGNWATLDHGRSLAPTVRETGVATLCQVTQSLVQEHCDEGLFTNVFGALYRYRLERVKAGEAGKAEKAGRGRKAEKAVKAEKAGKVEKLILHITGNLLSGRALKDNEQRQNPETYRPLVRHLLDYSYQQYYKTLEGMVDEAKNGRLPPTSRQGGPTEGPSDASSAK
ncbi:hypothetical protein EST38_g12204 [Candolleomyces aberdarensis]|uniref:Uncharacterized protein n=1 Tax=Candolleomyces aberdarensis TaxID=2316362 RepID=A0A4Q2D300_9AGAR|nr:hypothetical protein EST38_g12204 [Candolleomyces aberdarensis]